MKRIPVLTMLTALLALWTITLWAAVPQLINFQGILRDGSSNPVANGAYSVTFTIYDDPAAGNVFWAETTSVNTSSGLFTTLLGVDNPMPDSVFNDSSRYLGIKVGIDPEMTPRQKLTSVGYTFRTEQWTSAGNNLYRLNANVGVGTANPGAKLDVVGKVWIRPINADSTKVLLFDESSGAIEINTDAIVGTPPDLILGTYPNILNQLVLKQSSGNVGVGTTSPGKKLEVAGSIKVGTNDTVFSSNISSNSPLSLQAPAGTTRMFINDITGNVGIGTNSPANKLHISKNSGQGLPPLNSTAIPLLINNNAVSSDSNFTVLIAGSAGKAGLAFGDNSSALSGSVVYDNSSDNLSVQSTQNVQVFTGPGPSERMRITTNGTVGLGTTTPINLLDVEGGTAIGASYSGTQLAPTNGLLVEGKVGIGLSNPSKKLEVAGSIKVGTNDTIFTSYISGGSTFLQLQAPAGTGRIHISSTNGNVLIGPGGGAGSTLQVNGSFAITSRVTGISTTLDETDNVVLCTNIAAITITLPSVSVSGGRQYTVKRTAAGGVTVDPDAAETIDGAATYVLPAVNSAVTIINAAGSWRILSSH